MSGDIYDNYDCCFRLACQKPLARDFHVACGGERYCCWECYDANCNGTKSPPQNDSAARKAEPVHSGVFQYFPRALRAISRVSRVGNEKHNRGQPLHWAKEKSTDQPDCVARHNLTPYEIDSESGERHFVHAGWRQLAWIELCFEAVELGLCTWEELESGEIAVSQLGPKIVEARK